MAHELYHILLESAARQRRANRWFTASQRERFSARESLSEPLGTIAGKGFGPAEIDQLFNQLFDGITNLLYNCPIDMRIERKIRQDHPELKQAQFCGIAQLCHEARSGTLAPRVQETFPPAILRYNDALNVAYALFVDDLFHGATANAEAFRENVLLVDREWAVDCAGGFCWWPHLHKQEIAIHGDRPFFGSWTARKEGFNHHHHRRITATIHGGMNIR